MNQNKLGIKPASYSAIIDCTVAFAIGLLMLLFFTRPSFGPAYSIFWVFAVLPLIPIYGYLCSRAIPRIKEKNKDFWNLQFRILLRVTLVLLSLFIAYYFFLRYLGTYRPYQMSMLLLLAICFAGLLLLVVAPLAWLVYNYRLSKSTALALRAELGQSSANLDFLRSQINPHFLFNALNTLYATAIQENAGRTSEGIQKLGDMMRFMLRENIQNAIPLLREAEYLNNYIALQKLRTQTSADIVIETEIDEQDNDLQIAPMLLIPFVENAFKHGISLKEPSFIKITLKIKGPELLFDVKNSLHAKSNIDPEKDKGGIGLDNVRQRLGLLYPNDHDLVIRESAKEFFIHLTLNLKPDLNLYN